MKNGTMYTGKIYISIKGVYQGKSIGVIQYLLICYGTKERYIKLQIIHCRRIFVRIVLCKLFLQHTLTAAVHHGLILVYAIEFGNFCLIQLVVTPQNNLAEVKGKNGKQQYEGRKFFQNSMQ